MNVTRVPLAVSHRWGGVVCLHMTVRHIDVVLFPVVLAGVLGENIHLGLGVDELRTVFRHTLIEFGPFS